MEAMDPAAQGLRRVLESDRIQDRIAVLAQDLRTLAGDGPLVVLAILQAAAVFATDLVRALPGAVELAFVTARSYGKDTVSSGRVELGEMDTDLLAGARVVVVDTVLDTGLTLATVRDAARDAGAAHVYTCVLLDKAAPRAVEIRPDLKGFDVPDRFLVGYGLDYAGRYRALPYVGELDE